VTPSKSHACNQKSSLEALDKLGNPQDKLRVIHVTGTHGKGSVCAMICASLRRAGLKVGVYSSPHVKHWSECVTINGSSDLAGWKKSVAAVSEAVGGADGARGKLSPFEATTAAMWIQFGGCTAAGNRQQTTDNRQ
jgi:dihydrofolate synthase / folylpolyglutamate synthase